MVYRLTDVERKLVLNRLIPLAREVSVSEDLRGWSWYKSPLQPPYPDSKVPMYLVSSNWCPTSRDVYLKMVLKEGGKPNDLVLLGWAIHRAVASAYIDFQNNEMKDKEELADILRAKMSNLTDEVKNICWNLYQYVYSGCKTEYDRIKASQPYAAARDVIQTSTPYLIEHRISGELLGLSNILSVDCYDYLKGIVYDLKTNLEPQLWHRLYATGYALTLESLYEIPIDIGCIVYLKTTRDSFTLKKDIFFINDDLRAWWIEERDKKMELVSGREDPGVAGSCPENCIYWEVCH